MNKVFNANIEKAVDLIFAYNGKNRDIESARRSHIEFGYHIHTSEESRAFVATKVKQYQAEADALFDEIDVLKDYFIEKSKLLVSLDPNAFIQHIGDRSWLNYHLGTLIINEGSHHYLFLSRVIPKQYTIISFASRWHGVELDMSYWMLMARRGVEFDALNRKPSEIVF